MNEWLQKSKPMRNLVSKTVDGYPTALSSSASYSPGDTQSKEFKFGSHQYGETCIQRFEWKHSIGFSSGAIWCKCELQCMETCGRNDRNPFGTSLSHHNMTISPNFVGHLERVSSNVRQKHGRQPEDDMLEMDINMMIWGIFMSATLKAAVHRGQDRQEIFYVPPRTRTSRRSNSCLIFHRTWSRIKVENHLAFLQLIGLQFHG